MKPAVKEPCAHCGHARTEHYHPEDMEPVALLVKPGACLHRAYANGPRCGCSLYRGLDNQ